MFESKLNLELLLHIAEKLDYMLDGSGVYMHRYQSTRISIDGIFIEAAKEIGEIRDAKPIYYMVNKIPPNVCAPIHTDTLRPTPGHPERAPRIERWHLPLSTNEECQYWDEINGKIHNMEVGYWYGPIPYWIKHTVANYGTTDRIHLIIDLDKENHEARICGSPRQSV